MENLQVDCGRFIIGIQLIGGAPNKPSVFIDITLFSVFTIGKSWLVNFLSGNWRIQEISTVKQRKTKRNFIDTDLIPESPFDEKSFSRCLDS
jgi:hypothetical protein